MVKNRVLKIIENVSSNYSTVLSILNTESPINAKIKKSNHIGSLTWNGKNTGYVQLVDVPRLASVKKGDTILFLSEIKEEYLDPNLVLNTESQLKAFVSVLKLSKQFIV